MDVNLEELWTQVVKNNQSILDLEINAPQFTTRFLNLKTIFFMAHEHDLFSKKRKIQPEKRTLNIDWINSVLGQNYFSQWIKDYFNDINSPIKVETATKSKVDSALIELTMNQFQVSKDQALIILQQHSQIMRLENIAGDLLERFIDLNDVNHELIWCAGKSILMVDFIVKQDKILLQVKNKSNSENSSSSKIRKNTQVKKWHRFDANTAKTTWDSFYVRNDVYNEENYLKFIQEFK